MTREEEVESLCRRTCPSLAQDEALCSYLSSLLYDLSQSTRDRLTRTKERGREVSDEEMSGIVEQWWEALRELLWESHEIVDDEEKGRALVKEWIRALLPFTVQTNTDTETNRRSSGTLALSNSAPEEKESPLNGAPALLNKVVRIADKDEAEKAARARARQDRKDAEAIETERKMRELKVSKKRAAERERLAEEEKQARAVDEERMREDKKRATEIHVAALQQLYNRSNAEGHSTVHYEKDIHCNDLTLLAPDNSVLLSNTTLSLVHGRRYGITGRNGIGKSSLLRALSTYQIAGVPHYLKIAHVEQEASGTDLSVLETVLQADVEHQMLLQEEKAILQNRLEQPAASAVAQSSSSSSAQSDRLAQIYARLDAIDAWSAENRAASILAGLGFSKEEQQKPIKTLSGGWRMRVSLASALFISPTLLILDEPTNHLDLPSLLWLQNYLCAFADTLLVVSHDRFFLSDVTTDILHFSDNHTLEHYRGNYTSYLLQRQAKYVEMKRAYDAQQMQIEHIQSYIDTYYTSKKSSKQANMIGQVESKKKQLQAMIRLPNPDRTASQLSSTLKISFPDPPPLRQNQIAYTKDLCFKWRLNDESCPFLLKDVSLRIEQKARIGLMGKNGIGKSSLLKILLGELPPTSGTVWLNNAVQVAVFNQHFSDSLDLGINAVEALKQRFPGAETVEIRAHLGKFGLSGEHALLKLTALSGGQKARVLFAIMTWTKPHVLLLDEPTNHIDLTSSDILIEALRSFSGAVIIISHDLYFLQHTAQEYWAFVGGGVVKPMLTLESVKQASYNM